MNHEQLLKIFESHPILGTILIIASMFFMAVLWKDWPENLFGITFGASDDDDDDDVGELSLLRKAVKQTEKTQKVEPV